MLGSSTCAFAWATLKSWVLDEPFPDGYQPLMLTGSYDGPNDPISWRVTGPSPAFTKDWTRISSPAIGTGGRSLTAGFGLPAFTGML